jgi:hypothetical protein
MRDDAAAAADDDDDHDDDDDNVDGDDVTLLSGAGVINLSSSKGQLCRCPTSHKECEPQTPNI